MIRRLYTKGEHYINKSSAFISYHGTSIIKTFFPKNIGISVNNICNLRCIMCDVGQRNKNNEFYKNLGSQGDLLQLNDFIRFIKEVEVFKPRIIIHSTEPLLYSDIVELSEYIIQRKLPYSLTTNGYLLENYAECFVKIGLPSISISIDGLADIHNKIRGIENSFEKAYSGIEKLIYYKQKYNKVFPKINIASTILNLNVSNLERTVDFFQNIGVDSVKFTHYNFINEKMALKHNEVFGQIHTVSPSSIGAIDLKEIDTKKLFEQISVIKKNYLHNFVRFSPDLSTIEELNTYYLKPEIFLKKQRCVVPWTNIQLLANGDLIPAARCFHYIYGNIRESSFEEIWHGNRAINFRKELKNMGATPACSRCCGLFSSI